MKTITIGPSLSDVTIEGGKISAPMNGKTLVYKAPEGMEFAGKDYDAVKRAFWEACVISSRPWQVEGVLNDYFGIKGTFTITPIVGKEEVQLG